MENSNSDYPPHLSEFYSIVNNKETRNNVRPATNNSKNVPTHKYNKSVTSSLNSNISCLQDLAMIITSKDIDQLITYLNQLKTVSIKYSKTLEELSNDTVEFSNIINNLTRIKTCPNDNQILKNLLDSSGLFQIITNHHLLLSNSIKSYFVKSLNEIIDKIRNYYNAKYDEFNKFDQLQLIKLNQLKENYYNTNRTHYHKNRHDNHRFEDNLIQIKQNLNDLQIQLNEMELSRFNYYNDLIEFNDSIFANIINRLATISKIHLEINENIARKNWPDGGLNELLSHSDDDILFNNNNYNTNDNNNSDSSTHKVKKEREEEEQNKILQLHNNNNNNTSNNSDDNSNDDKLSKGIINNNNNNDNHVASTTSLKKYSSDGSIPLCLENNKQSSFSNKGNNNNNGSTNHINNDKDKNNTILNNYIGEDEHDQSFSLPLTIPPTSDYNNINNSEEEEEEEREEENKNENIETKAEDLQQNSLSNILDPNLGASTIIDQSSI